MIHRLPTAPSVVAVAPVRPRHAARRPSLLARIAHRRRVARTHGPLLAYGTLAPHNRADLIEWNL